MAYALFIIIFQIMQKKISLERLNVISSCNAYSSRNETEHIFLQNAIYFIKMLQKCIYIFTYIWKTKTCDAIKKTVFCEVLKPLYAIKLNAHSILNLGCMNKCSVFELQIECAFKNISLSNNLVAFLSILIRRKQWCCTYMSVSV